eukprot:732969-Amphidinium_carterae.2
MKLALAIESINKHLASQITVNIGNSLVVRGSLVAERRCLSELSAVRQEVRDLKGIVRSHVSWQKNFKRCIFNQLAGQAWLFVCPAIESWLDVVH